MRYLPTPPPPDPVPFREHRLWTGLLLGSAAVTVLATRWPWLRVKFERLFQDGGAPAAWQSTAGFTCLASSLMIAVMALVESGSETSRQAVRPGSLMLAGIALLTLAATLVAGPGELRGVTATWTPWFYVACGSLPILTMVCLRRYANLRRRHG